MGEEEQPGTWSRKRLASVIKRRYQSLSCTGRGDNKIAEIALIDPLRLKLIESCLLVGMWPQIEKYRGPRISLPGPSARIIQRLFHAPTEVLVIGTEMFKFLVAPKGVESATETLNNMWRFNLA